MLPRSSSNEMFRSQHRGSENNAGGLPPGAYGSNGRERFPKGRPGRPKRVRPEIDPPNFLKHSSEIYAGCEKSDYEAEIFPAPGTAGFTPKVSTAHLSTEP